jgi:hypothetical protein
VPAGSVVSYTNVGTVSGTSALGPVLASESDGYTGVTVCDVNGDGKINKTDVNSIVSAIGATVSAGDPRDYVVNGVLTINDSNGCKALCSKPLCAL